MPIAWTNGGAPAINGANLNQLAVTADMGTPGTPTGDALKAAALPRWKASTPYSANDIVLNPSGQIVQAIATFTSGTTYSASNWTPLSTAPTISSLPAGLIVYMVQNGDGSWPNRLSSRTDLLGMWVKTVTGSADPAAATSPAVTGAYTNDVVVGV